MSIISGIQEEKDDEEKGKVDNSTLYAQFLPQLKNSPNTTTASYTEQND